MGRMFEVRGKDKEKFFEDGWLGWSGAPLFFGLKCSTEDLGQGITEWFFYPEPAELRQRLAALEADPAPIAEVLRETYSIFDEDPESVEKDVSQGIPAVLDRMRTFIACYEREFANVSDWKPLYRRVVEPDDDDVPDDHCIEEDASGDPPGEPVEFGAPQLMAVRVEYEKEPFDRHRTPYITWL